MSFNQIKVNTLDLLIGMYVARLDRSWLETPYKIQGLLIKSQKDIDKLLQYSDHVYVDTEKSIHLNGSAQKQGITPTQSEKIQLLTKVKPVNYENKTEFDSELDTARENHKALTSTAKGVVDDVLKNKTLELSTLRKAVNPMVESILRNSDAYSWLAMMKTRDSYTYNHSVSASIWAVVLGRRLGLPVNNLKSLAMGALLFDIGKIKLPKKLIDNPRKYNRTEFKLVKTHVEHSLDIVQSIKGIDDNVLEMIATHHERHNGDGYPKGIRGYEIPLFGKIAGIVDCYDALISERVFASAIPPHDAIRKLYDWSNIDFQQELVEQFIQVVGIYPVGTLVELSDGRVGVIVAQHKARRLRPKVMLILNQDKKPYSKFDVIDLYDVEQDEDSQPLLIDGSVEPERYGIDPRQFFL